MIALGGPKLKLRLRIVPPEEARVSMIALGGPKLKLEVKGLREHFLPCFNDSTGWA